MPGTILGNGCIVGAGAVVTKSFPDGSIVAGNPAKIIGVRDMDKFLKCLANEYTYLKQKAIDRLEKIERTSRGAIDLAK
jgi:serine acetyltransferase